GDVVVLTGKDPLPTGDQRDLAAELGEHARELQRDRPAADDRQPRRERLDVLQGGGVVDPRTVGAGHIEDARDTAGVDYHGVGGDVQGLRTAGDAYLPGAGELRPGADHQAYLVHLLKHRPV